MGKLYDLFNETSEKLLKLVYWPLLVLRTFFFPLSKLTFVMFILAIGCYAICINDQGKDMMAAFTAKNIFDYDNLYLRLFELFILFWAIATWNVARVLLAAANLKSIIESQVGKQEQEEVICKPIDREKMILVYIDSTYQRWLKWANDWVPRILTLIPYLIFFYGYLDQEKAFKSYHPWNTIVMAIVAVAHILYVCFRRKIIKRFLGKDSSSDFTILEEEKNLIKAIKKSRVGWNTVLTILMVMLMFIYSIWAASSQPEQNGKPGLIVITSLTFYTLIGLVINYAINRVKVPLFFIAVLVSTLVFFNWNNNHAIQTLVSSGDMKMLEDRNAINDVEYADYWLSKRFPDTALSYTTTLFVVAAEGGGIRNCYWTYSVLSKLQKIKPDFIDRTFAVTGVSGGSIGLGFFYNSRYIFDKHRNKIKDSTLFFTQLDTIASSDYLSRVTFGFLFPDLIQRFLPFPIESWDRSKMLANSFDDGFSKRFNIGKNLLSENYLSIWSDTSMAYKYPVVLYNTILNEDGMKAVFSPFRLSDSYYPDVVDLLLEINQSVPIKEAMTSSARFPIITAPGLLKRYDALQRKDTSRIGHISDGGGFENTGIHTAQQTARLLRDRIIAKRYKGQIKVKVIYIGSGLTPIEIPDQIPADKRKLSKAINKRYEIAWLPGAVNTIFSWMKSAHNENIRIDSNYRLLQFGLAIKDDSTKHQLPLGWYLSDTSRLLIKSQLNDATLNPQLRANLDRFKTMN